MQEVKYTDVSSVTYNDIKIFIDKYKFDRQCEFCSNDDWLLWGSNDKEKENIEITLQKSPAFNALSGSLTSRAVQRYFFACYSLSCSTCGYIRFFSKNAVLNFVKNENGNEGKA